MIQCFSSARWIHWKHSSFKTYLDKWVTLWGLVAWGHPGASTIHSQLLDGDCSYGWQTLAIQPWAPTLQGIEVGSPVPLIKSVEKWDTRDGGMLINKPRHNNTNAWNCVFQWAEESNFDSSAHWKTLFIWYVHLRSPKGIWNPCACYIRSLLTNHSSFAIYGDSIKFH